MYVIEDEWELESAQSFWSSASNASSAVMNFLFEFTAISIIHICTWY